MNTSELLNVVISLVIALASAYVGPVAYQLLAGHLGKANADLLSGLARTAVEQTEQKAKSSDLHGDAKKQAALAVLDGLIKSRGLKVDSSTLEAFVEQAVYQLNQLALHVFTAEQVQPVVTDAPVAAADVLTTEQKDVVTTPASEPAPAPAV